MTGKKHMGIETLTTCFNQETHDLNGNDVMEELC